MVLVKVGTGMFTRTAWRGVHIAQEGGSSEGQHKKFSLEHRKKEKKYRYICQIIPKQP